ncbi:MAG: hypothetical protein ACTSQ8_23570 [Candidatus Helarchaeota archaeon]
MAKKRMLERIEWGKYRVNSPQEYLKKKTNIMAAYETLKDAGMDYALTGPDAVFFWTKGGYQVDRFFGFYPIHLKVKKENIEEWRGYFQKTKNKVHFEGDSIKETLFGVFYVAYPRKEFIAEQIDGFFVDTLEDTVKFCQQKIYSYEPALEMLNEMYELGLDIEYREIDSNF